MRRETWCVWRVIGCVWILLVNIMVIETVQWRQRMQYETTMFYLYNQTRCTFPIFLVIYQEIQNEHVRYLPLWSNRPWKSEKVPKTYNVWLNNASFIDFFKSNPSHFVDVEAIMLRKNSNSNTWVSCRSPERFTTLKFVYWKNSVSNVDTNAPYLSIPKFLLPSYVSNRIFVFNTSCKVNSWVLLNQEQSFCLKRGYRLPNHLTLRRIKHLTSST